MGTRANSGGAIWASLASGVFGSTDKVSCHKPGLEGEARKFTPTMNDFGPAFNTAYGTLAQHCSYRERSAAEVRQKMERMGLQPEWQDALLEKLQQDGFQSESRFARAFTRDKYSLEDWGRIKIRQHLQQRGLDEGEIDRAFDHMEEALYCSNLRRVLSRHAAGLKGHSGFELRGRLYRFAQSRGYEPALIWEMIRELGYGEGGEEAEAANF